MTKAQKAAKKRRRTREGKKAFDYYVKKGKIKTLASSFGSAVISEFEINDQRFTKVEVNGLTFMAMNLPKFNDPTHD